MTVPSKTISQFVADMTATWGQGIGFTPDLSPGDFLLALFEAFSGQLDFLQAQAFVILKLTRATTSTGADLDSWMADFAFLRLPATSATGPVQLSLTQTSSGTVFVQAATLVDGVYQGGVLVQTVGGGVVFQVIPDTAETAYDPLSNSYVLPAGGTAVTVTVQALVSGSSSNVSAGQITQLASQQSAISLVNNLVPISNGQDAESDANFRARFILYLSTLAKATRAAILAAAQSVQQGLQISLAENQDSVGNVQLGAFTVFVDDGTGSPSAALLASVFAAVDATRAFSVQAFVAAPNIFNATVVLSVRLAATATLGLVQPLVEAAVAGVAEALGAGETLFVSAINQAVLAVSGVVAVQSGTTINGVAGDLVPAPNVEVRVLLTGVSVGEY